MAKPKVVTRRNKRTFGNTLPVQLTKFIGRKQELERVRQMLNSARLLTLTGSGGCGKTRLALQVLEYLSQSVAYPDGIVWVDLASLKDGSLVPQAVSTSLGLHEKANEPVTQTIVQEIASREILLALDNCEHLAASCASLVELILRACPNSRVLTTSREALGVPGEVSWLVPSLSVPETSLEAPNIIEVGQSDAVQLFIDRAAAISPGFSLSEQNATAVLRICNRLEGIPLAIELAAAQVRMLTVDQIAIRLDNIFVFLTSGNRTATIPRHQTLRAAIGWSYDLLQEAEMVLFRRLAVFIGGFSLEAVEAIASEPPSADNKRRLEVSAPATIFNLLSSLVYKSLVIAVTPEHGEARYYLLETIRQFALEKLGAVDETGEYRERHAHWYLLFSENAEMQWRGPQQSEWLERAEQEHDNLRAALRWCEERGAVEDELRIASALLRFWIVRGYLREGRGVLEKALSKSEAAPDAVRAKAFHAVGTVASRQGDYPAARGFLEEALALRRMSGDKHGISITLNNLASVAINQRDYPGARSLLEDSVAIKRELNDKVGLAYSLGNLGEVARQEGDYTTAYELYEESLSLLRKLDDKDTVAIVLVSLGNLNLVQGDYLHAAGRFNESLPMAKQLGNKWAIAMCVAGLAAIARVNGELIHAARLLGAAQALVNQIGMPLEPVDRIEFERNIAETKAQMDGELFSTAWSDGLQMDLEQILIETVSSSRWTMERKGQEKLVITAFGPARVSRGDHVVASSEWKGVKTKELLFLLLSRPAINKEQIGLALWPDASPSQLRNNLGVVMHTLRQALGKPEWILFENYSYKFNRKLDHTFDVQRFEALLQLSKKDPDPDEAIKHLHEAINLYHGDFLEDFMEGEWFIEQREELRQKLIEAMLALGKLYFDQAKYAQAADAYRQAIARDSYLESAHRGLMHCYARLGEHGQAIRHYHELSDLLKNELDARPAPETRELYERLRTGADF